MGQPWAGPMISLSRVRRRTAIVVPTYFQPGVPEKKIRSILESTFQDQEVYCPREQVLIVVDCDTTAASVVANAGEDSSLHGIPVHLLERNRAKAGAIEVGLRQLLEATGVEYLVTRDCDGDHRLEDLPRLVAMADFLRQSGREEPLCVMGARPSLEKPMGWVREQWEELTNRVLIDLLSFALAGRKEVLDRRFWWRPPDIQSGYRLYDRKAAELVVESLAAVPDEVDVRALSCEFIPFADLVMEGAVIGQVDRFTMVEQPVSSYSDTDFPAVYGRLLEFSASHLGIDDSVLLRLFDNRLLNTSLFFTDARAELLRCREILAPQADPVVLPPFV